MIEKFYASTAPKIYSMQVQDSDFEFGISMHVHALMFFIESKEDTNRRITP